MSDATAAAERIRSGDRRALARAITLVESARADHQRDAEALLSALGANPGGALRIGISGSPGVGKSTFIEALGLHLLDRGHKLAVLAIDPSSALSGGAILGDKTRMEQLARREQAFIRPSPSGGTLGGVARRTGEAILLCEAAGFDVVIVETVGVGQSETAVRDLTDAFVLLVQPGGGDQLQGIKRGILELADVLVVTKADGELAQVAGHAVADYRAALALLRPAVAGWQVPVVSCSALEGKGVDEVWSTVERYCAVIRDSGLFGARRSHQAVAWMWAEVREVLESRFRGATGVAGEIERLETAVAAGELSPRAAGRRLLDRFFGAPGLDDGPPVP